MILPRENETDLVDLPPETREALTFIPADTIEDVFAAAFDGRPPRALARGPPAVVERQAARSLGLASASAKRREQPAAGASSPCGAGGRAAGAPAGPSGRT